MLISGPKASRKIVENPAWSYKTLEMLSIAGQFLLSFASKRPCISIQLSSPPRKRSTLLKKKIITVFVTDFGKPKKLPEM